MTTAPKRKKPTTRAAKSKRKATSEQTNSFTAPPLSPAEEARREKLWEKRVEDAVDLVALRYALEPDKVRKLLKKAAAAKWQADKNRYRGGPKSSTALDQHTLNGMHSEWLSNFFPAYDKDGKELPGPTRAEIINAVADKQTAAGAGPAARRRIRGNVRAQFERFMGLRKETRKGH
jgi:hypothetical protein